MITFAELHGQIHRITELSNVFLYMIQDRAMCDTSYACDLFFEYKQRVKDLAMQAHGRRLLIVFRLRPQFERLLEEINSGDKITHQTADMPGSLIL